MTWWRVLDPGSATTLNDFRIQIAPTLGRLQLLPLSIAEWPRLQLFEDPRGPSSLKTDNGAF
jgi:hypothetical protein